MANPFPIAGGGTRVVLAATILYLYGVFAASRLHPERLSFPSSKRTFQPVLESTRTYFDSGLSRKPARRRHVPAPSNELTATVKCPARRPRLSSPPTI